MNHGSGKPGESPAASGAHHVVEQRHRAGGSYALRTGFASHDSENPPAALDEARDPLPDVPAADDQQALATKASGQCPEASARHCHNRP